MNTKVVIIGAGIAGISAAIYLKRANIDFALLSNSNIGGSLSKIKELENYPGFIGSGEELQAKLNNQLKELDIEPYFLNVQSVVPSSDGFEVITDHKVFNSKYIIIASGLDFKPSAIEHETEFVGKGVSYCVTCDAFFFKGKKVAICGGGEALKESISYLKRLVSKLYVVSDDTVEEDDIVTKVKGNIIRINGNDKVESITLDTNEEIEVDGVFPLNGYKNSSIFLSLLNLEKEKQFIKVNEVKETSYPNAFAIGDITNTKLRQLVTAASDGALAANEIIKRIK